MLKVIIGSVWTMTILYFFIKNHTYYQESLAFLPKIFMSVGGFMLSIAVVLGLQYAWKKIRKPENANKITKRRAFDVSWRNDFQGRGVMGDAARRSRT